MSTVKRSVDPGQRSLSHQYHAFYPWAALKPEDVIVIDRGEGVYVYDTRGKRYLDAISGAWNVTQGFSCAPLIEAATAQLNRLPYYHTLYNRVSDVSIELSQVLAGLIEPTELKVIYGNSGSDAVEAAIKMAWLYHMAQGRPAKRKIISRQGSVHGSTVYSACVGGLGMHELFGAEIGGIVRVASPNYRLYGAPGETRDAFTDRLIRELDEVIAREGKDTIAAMIIEPIPVVEGFELPPPDYLERLAKTLREHEILLICDEVVTSFGRTGEMLASTGLKLSPDMLVVSKTLTSGYAALGATLLSKAVADAVDACCSQIGEFPHALTTGTHPVAMRVALTNLRILQEPGGALANVASVSPTFSRRLERFSQLEGVAAWRAVGLGGSLHLEPVPGHDDISFEVAHACRTRGAFVHGQHGSLIVAPSLIISEASVNELFDIMEDAYRSARL